MMALSLIVQFWLLVALFCLIFEMSAPGLFYSFSFALGALVTAGVAGLLPDFTFMAQAWIFLLTSVGMLVVVHLLGRIFMPKGKEIVFLQYQAHSNVDGLIGKKVSVIKLHGIGVVCVRVGGETWFARCVNEEPLVVGDVVVIKNVIGTKLTVQKLCLKL